MKVDAAGQEVKVGDWLAVHLDTLTLFEITDLDAPAGPQYIRARYRFYNGSNENWREAVRDGAVANLAPEYTLLARPLPTPKDNRGKEIAVGDTVAYCQYDELETGVVERLSETGVYVDGVYFYQANVAVVEKANA